MSTNLSRQRYRYLRISGRKKRACLRVILLMFTVTGCAVSAARGELEGDIELLKLVATTHKNNRESIHTWQGSAKSETIYRDSNGVLVHEKNSATFLLDTKKDAIRCKWIEEERLGRIEGRLVSDRRDLETINTMRKGAGYYKYAHGYTLNDGTKLNSLVIWPGYKARREAYGSGFDPMRYMTGHITKCTDDLAERLMYYYRRASSFKSTSVKVSREGNVVTLEVQGEVALNHHEFDLSKGGNIVKYYGESDGGTELREWTYEQKDGVWVLQTFSKDLKWNEPQPSHLGGFTNEIGKVTFADNTVNRPMPASEFSLEALGVKVGDRVTDQVKGIAYVYGVEKELPLEKEEPLLKEMIEVITETDNGKQDVAETQGQEPWSSDDEAAQQTTVGQIKPRGEKKNFVLGLVILLIIGLSTFAIVRNCRKRGAQA